MQVRVHGLGAMTPLCQVAVAKHPHTQTLTSKHTHTHCTGAWDSLSVEEEIILPL